MVDIGGKLYAAYLTGGVILLELDGQNPVLAQLGA